MRTLTFDRTNFYIDHLQNIGDYIEITNIKSIGSRRVKGHMCYSYCLDLVFSCNLGGTERVKLFTFCEQAHQKLTQFCVEPKKRWSLRVCRKKLVGVVL